MINCKPGKKGRQPWHLLTDELVESDRSDWRLVHAYARRRWSGRTKLLQSAILAYAFLLSLLERGLDGQVRASCGRVATEQESGATALPHPSRLS